LPVRTGKAGLAQKPLNMQGSQSCYAGRIIGFPYFQAVLGKGLSVNAENHIRKFPAPNGLESTFSILYKMKGNARIGKSQLFHHFLYPTGFRAFT